MRILLFLFASLFFVSTQTIAQETVSFKGYAYGEMRDVAKGLKLDKGSLKLYDEKGETLVAESTFSASKAYSFSVESEKTYLMKIYDADGKVLKEGPFGISKDYYSKNETLEKGRWVPFEEGRKEYGLAIFTATAKLPVTKYEASSSESSRSVGSMPLPDLMSSLTELRAFSW